MSASLPQLPRSDGADDRRLCADCRHFKAPVCRIAKPGGVVSAKYGYQPAEAGLLRRCRGFAASGNRGI